MLGALRLLDWKMQRLDEPSSVSEHAVDKETQPREHVFEHVPASVVNALGRPGAGTRQGKRSSLVVLLQAASPTEEQQQQQQQQQPQQPNEAAGEPSSKRQRTEQRFNPVAKQPKQPSWVDRSVQHQGNHRDGNVRFAYLQGMKH